MTFYWWSHWFWITSNLQVIAVLLILLPNAIHTYPSQQQEQEEAHELSVAYTSGTRGVGSVEAFEMQNTQKLQQITKLYQTTASLAWATTSAPSMSMPTLSNKAQNVMDLTNKPAELTSTPTTPTTTTTVASSYAGMHRNSKELTQEFKRSADFDKSSNNNNNKSIGIDNADDNADNADADDVDNKHVAGNDSDAAVAAAASLQAADAVAAGSQTVAVAHMLNNYTNYSRKASTKTKANTTTTATTTAQAPTNKSNNNNNSSNMSQKATSTSTSATPLVGLAKATTASAAAIADGLGAVVPTTPSAAMAATPSTPQINTAAEFEQHEAEEQQQQQQQQRAPFTLENVNAEDELRRAEVEHRARKSKGLSAEYKHINRYINLSSDTKSLLTRSASTAPNDFETDDGNISSEALSIQRTYFLDAGAISAICFTVFGICCTVGTIGIVLYRRRYLNKPQALSEPDSSVYIDDSTMRDNSDEMYSLDNDSFLNSLEAMTIQNYWTDTVKHTKL